VTIALVGNDRVLGGAPMLSLFVLRVYRRLLVAGGVLALAYWFVGAAPFWNVASAPGATNGVPQLTVSQSRKGDRLPVIKPPVVWHDLPVPESLQHEQKVPLGCDRAFSPVAAPGAKSIYGRCLA
jgi:hypothetical protein